MKRRHIKSTIRNDFTKSIWQIAGEKIWDTYVKLYNSIMIFVWLAAFFIIAHSSDPYYERTMIRDANLLFTACVAGVLSYPWKKLELISLPFIVYVIIYYVVYWDEMQFIFEKIWDLLS